MGGYINSRLQNQGLIVNNGVSLPPAILLALTGNDFQLVPAPGPNLILVPQLILWKMKFGGTPYTATGTITLKIGATNFNVLQPPAQVGFVDQGTDIIAWSFPTAALASVNPAALINQPLFLHSPSLTGGNGTMDVLTYYSLMSSQ